MKLQQRDRRALLLLAAAVAVFALLWFWQNRGAAGPSAAPPDSIPVAEKRLERVRRHAASVPGKEQVLKQVTAELAAREKGLLEADTAPQAQARLIDVVRRVAQSLSPPLDFGTTEMGRQVTRLGDDYGEVQLTVPFTCHIEDLVNFLAELTRQPEAVATTELRINAGDAKQKTIHVRLTVSGVVPGRLVPEKKGAL